MQKIINIITNLKQLSGTKQLNYLKQYKNTPCLKEILWYTYNPNLKFHINEAKLNKALEKFPVEYSDKSLTMDSWNNFKAYLDKFSKQKGVKEAEIDSFVELFWKHYSHDELELFKEIILKDLRINMGVSLFNKVWSDFYVVPEVMLAKKFEGKKPEHPSYSRKFDGMRAFYLDGKFYSRTYKELNTEPLKHVLEALKDFPADKVLDGEMIYFDADYKENFQKTVALVGKEIYQDGCENIQYVIFDMLDRDEFLAKEIQKPFLETYKDLLGYFEKSDCRNTIEYGLLETVYNEIKVVAQFEEESFNFLSKNVDKYNWEGLMMRDVNKPYECKRTSALQKIKKMQDGEFELVGLKEGTGKYVGSLGALTIKLPTGELVDVGSGYTDAVRKKIYDEFEDIKKSGVLVKVQYFEKTVDKHGSNSLRFPVFLAFRDKDGNETI